MRRYLIIVPFTLILITIISVVGCAPRGDADDIDDRVTTLEEKVSTLEQQVETLIEEIDSLQQAE